MINDLIKKVSLHLGHQEQIDLEGSQFQFKSLIVKEKLQFRVFVLVQYNYHLRYFIRLLTKDQSLQVLNSQVTTLQAGSRLVISTVSQLSSTPIVVTYYVVICFVTTFFWLNSYCNWPLFRKYLMQMCLYGTCFYSLTIYKQEIAKVPKLALEGRPRLLGKVFNQYQQKSLYKSFVNLTIELCVEFCQIVYVPVSSFFRNKYLEQ